MLAALKLLRYSRLKMSPLMLPVMLLLEMSRVMSRLISYSSSGISPLKLLF